MTFSCHGHLENYGRLGAWKHDVQCQSARKYKFTCGTCRQSVSFRRKFQKPAAGSTASEPPLEEDEAFMRQALDLARRGLGKTHPNPAVGCVIVRDGVVVGEGYHPKAGEPHAEVFALRAAGQLARGATAYVTLEPCNHFGRTPPCSRALVAAGVARVVVGAGDPNPLVGGAGIATLRSAGISVLPCVEEQACYDINREFMERMAAAAAAEGAAAAEAAAAAAAAAAEGSA